MAALNMRYILCIAMRILIKRRRMLRDENKKRKSKRKHWIKPLLLQRKDLGSYQTVESYWLTDRTSILSFFCYVNFMLHMFWRLFLYLVLKKFMKKQEAIYSCPSFCGKIQIFTIGAR